MTTEERVFAILQKIEPRIRADQSINEVFDSLQLVELLDSLEREFSIQFPSARLMFLEKMDVLGISREVDRQGAEQSCQPRKGH